MLMKPMQPQLSNYVERVRASFARQSLMQTIGAQLAKIEPGVVEISMPIRDDLSQQNGYVHAGIVTTIVDTACGYAAYTLMGDNSGVLTIEFKVNFLNPAVGDLLLARGQVIKAGRRISVCQGDVFSLHHGEEHLIATMLATMINIAE
jgi:uncharacterized protein (TIGR00369 family)